MKRMFSLVIGCLLTVAAVQAQVTDTLRRDTTTISSDVERRSNDLRTDPTYYDRKPGLPWFQRGGAFAGGSLGFGTGKGQGFYLVVAPRLAYFLQPGFAVGLRGSFESRLSTSYRANSGGAFVRYYPVRNNFYLFGEGGFNLGKYRSSDVGPNDPRRFSAINLGLGVGLRATDIVSFELMLENNYYDKSPVLAGSNRGPQIKIGVNVHLASRQSRSF